MTYPLTVPERLLTWLDVERVLKQKTQLWSLMPEGLVGGLLPRRDGHCLFRR